MSNPLDILMGNTGTTTSETTNQSFMPTFIPSFGMQGEAILNWIILTYVMANVASFCNIIKNLFHVIWTIFVNRINNYCKNKLIGNIVYRMQIEDNDPIHIFLNNTVLQKYDSDVANNKKSWILSFFLFFKDVNISNREEMINKWKNKKNNVINVKTNYGSDKFQGSLVKKSYTDQITTRIYHDNDITFIIKSFKSTAATSNTTIIIKIVNYDKNINTPQYYVNRFKTFLDTRFNYGESLELLYKVTINNGQIAKMLSTKTSILASTNEYLQDKNTENTEGNESNFLKIDNTSTWSEENKSGKLILSNHNLPNHDARIKRFNIGRIISCYVIDNFQIILNHETDNIGNHKTINYLGNNLYVYNVNIISKTILDKDKIAEITNKFIHFASSLEQAPKPVTTQKKQVYIYKRDKSAWKGYEMDKRTLDSVFLPNKQFYSIKREFDTFIKMDKIYKEFQIPYRKGVLFFGPPGTGKTSLVKALAYEYQINVYLININDEDINDDTIIDVLNSMGNVGQNKILLFEDIDSAFVDKEVLKIQQREKEKEIKMEEESSTIKLDIMNNTDNEKTNNHNTQTDTNININNTTNATKILPPAPVEKPKFLTYSGLLNAFDGVLSNQTGVITIMTTNYVAKLGKAFIRPGRIDKMFHLGCCTSEQIENMIKSLVKKRDLVFEKPSEMNEEKLQHNINEFIAKLCDDKGMSQIEPCRLQFYVLRYISVIQDIFDNIDELINQEVIID